MRSVTIGMQLLLRSQEELVEGNANASKDSKELSLFESCFGSYARKDQSVFTSTPCDVGHANLEND